MVLEAGTVLLIVGIIAAVIIIGILLTFVPVMLWISALAAGVRIGIFTLVGMRS